MRKVLLVLLLVIGAVIGYLVGLSTRPACPAVERIVGITGDSAPFTIIPDPVIVQREDTLKWLHPTADLLQIDLGEAPTADRRLRAARGDTAMTIVLPTAPFDTFKYSVTVTVGTETSTEDPEIIVKPKGMLGQT